jgi:uncharacterized protein YndB with AHSA1/START domain
VLESLRSLLNIVEKNAIMTTKLIVKQTYYIQAPPSKVFSALTDPKWLTKWFLQKAKLKLIKGYEYEFVWIGGWKENGAVLDFQKDKKLVLKWPAHPNGSSKATFTLQKKGKYTVLKLKHEFPNSNKYIEMWAGTKSGWAYYLMNLKSVMENGKDLRHPEDNIM